jgi:hypothetical protein
VSRLESYLAYHRESARIGDIDPSYAMLRYVADRFELSLEQRYWVAWLYAMTYCGASAFYIYNEFPDFETVDVGRLQRWWDERGREAVICQTDRRWVRSSNMFVPAFKSYRSWMRVRPGDGTQHDSFSKIVGPYGTPEARYSKLYEVASDLYSFGQFALFLYLEALHTITPLDLCPTDLDLNRAWSCRNGLYYAYGMDQWIVDTESRTAPEAREETERAWRDLRATLAQLEEPPTVWQTETLLCAYRKWHRGKRYIGYYLDRQADEIAKMQAHVPEGVCWDVLWDYRRETYLPEVLAETQGAVSHRGVHRSWKTARELQTRAVVDQAWPGVEE